jgi:DNA invertase Pin-like site-specific DNA recombinase
MLGMIAVWSALESDLASERTTDALEAVRERGTKLGAPGMVERVGPDGVRVVDPQKLEVVRRTQARYAAGGWSHRRLADALNTEGVPTLGPKPSARWHATTVRIALATELEPATR